MAEVDARDGGNPIPSPYSSPPPKQLQRLCLGLAAAAALPGISGGGGSACFGSSRGSHRSFSHLAIPHPSSPSLPISSTTPPIANFEDEDRVTL
uniref:Uncharacterized protein n=1 Tax=Oryza glumipatula TaxID=40148 RepID=A0A0D9ZH04_9ORYZ